jgi:hypothetical protein
MNAVERRIGGIRKAGCRILGAAHFNGITMDYHDLKMFQLEQAAEESLKNALLALDRGEVTAQREVRRWANTLDNIRQMKTVMARISVQP